MYRIRFHGRGGQGIKTAGRILGSALFRAGYEVQDAPRYGAERRGAPIFAYVRAARGPIRERGVIRRPDLVVVADDTLVALPAADVLQGLEARSVLLVHSAEPAQVWVERLNAAGTVLALAPAEGEADALAGHTTAGACCAGAAARLLGVVPIGALEAAIGEELAALGPDLAARSLARAREGYEAMAAHAGRVREGGPVSAAAYRPPDWVDLSAEDVTRAAPAIHRPLTSVLVRTGLWRTLRPVLDPDRCSRCWWVCGSLCPDGAIGRDALGYPLIDYDHCKGCLVCLAQCPAHAIHAVPEHEAQPAERQGAA